MKSIRKMTTRQNRNPVKQWFITFPKSNIDKHTFRDDLIRLDPNFYKIVQESHSDGTPHLHAIIKLAKACTKSQLLKRFKEMYPSDNKRIDVQPVRSIQHALTYLSKEDSTPLTSGEFEDSRNPQRATRDILARQFGFSSATDLLEYQRNYRATMLKFKAEIHELHQEFIHSPPRPPYHINTLSYENLIIYNKLFSDSYVSKNDMTNLKSFYLNY